MEARIKVNNWNQNPNYETQIVQLERKYSR
jgi:hypothetical protein